MLTLMVCLALSLLLIKPYRWTLKVLNRRIMNSRGTKVIWNIILWIGWEILIGRTKLLRSGLLLIIILVLWAFWIRIVLTLAWVTFMNKVILSMRSIVRPCRILVMITKRWIILRQAPNLMGYVRRLLI